jgi:drug/metabolite transporter (DMT)-like permease
LPPSKVCPCPSACGNSRTDTSASARPRDTARAETHGSGLPHAAATMTASTVGAILAFLSMCCYATNILVARVATARAPIDLGFPVLLVGNILFAGTLFLADLAVRDTPFVFQWTGVGWFVLSGFFGIYLGRRTLLDAVKLLGPARASVLHTATPISTLAAAWLLVGERLGPYEYGLAAVVILGLWFTQPRASGTPASDSLLRKGLLLGAITVTCFGIGNALRGIAIRAWNEPAFGAVIGSAAPLMLVLAANRRWGETWRRIKASDRGGLGLYALGGFITVTGTMLGSVAMTKIEISIAMLISYTTPLIVFPISVFVLRNQETISGRTIFGATLVLTGVVLLAFR